VDLFHLYAQYINILFVMLSTVLRYLKLMKKTRCLLGSLTVHRSLTLHYLTVLLSYSKYRDLDTVMSS
jgi:hypothetical protein